MKIGQKPEGVKPEALGAVDARAHRPREVVAPQGSRVDISDLSRELRSVAARLAAGTAFDAARVDAVRQAIAEGRFRVDAEVVADRLIAATREHVSKPKA